LQEFGHAKHAISTKMRVETQLSEIVEIRIADFMA